VHGSRLLLRRGRALPRPPCGRPTLVPESRTGGCPTGRPEAVRAACAANADDFRLRRRRFGRQWVCSARPRQARAPGPAESTAAAEPSVGEIYTDRASSGTREEKNPYISLALRLEQLLLPSAGDNRSPIDRWPALIGVGKRRRGAWPDHHLMLGVSLAMSADSEDLDRLVTTRQQTSGRTVAPPTGAPRWQVSVMGPEQIIAARLPSRQSGGDGSEGADTTRGAPGGSPMDHGQRCETSSFGLAAANDPLIKSPALVAPHHDTTSREATQGGSGKLPGSPIERRRSDRRHIARRRDDGQPGYWRRDDRRTVERRMHARPD